MQLVRTIPSSFKQPKGTSKTAGTQVIDRWWEAVDRFLPPQLANKKNKGGPLNEALFDYVLSFVWRQQLHSDTEMRGAIGKLCKFRVK